MTADQEILEVVDESDRVIGRAPRAEIHRRRLRHRSAHVFVFDPGGRLFLQFRSPTKDQYPEHWDSSAAGHVDPGESYLGCAHRELKEELGLEAELTEVLRVPAQPRTGYEYAVLYQAVTTDEPRPNPDEITEGRFFEIEAAQEMIDDPGVPTAPALDLLFTLWRQGDTSD